MGRMTLTTPHFRDEFIIGSLRLDFTLMSMTLSETRVCNKVRWVRSASVQITLDGPDQTLWLVGSGRVVSKFHYTDPTTPDPRTAWVSDKSTDFVWS